MPIREHSFVAARFSFASSGTTLPPERERVPSPAPSPVAGSEGHVFRSITAGAGHNCALTETGHAYCWGENLFGALGDGTTAGSARPVPVTGGHLFTDITAGTFHTCGLATDGSAYCWGDNSYGQFGTGEAPLHPNPEPVRVPLNQALRSITAGALHTCAVTTEGTGYCWGQSGWGRLGHYQWEEFVPNAMAGEVRFATINAGRLHSCGLDAEGGARCWGSSDDGALGTVLLPSWPMARFEAVPVEAAPGLQFVELSTGGTHACGRTAEGSVYCFGCDANGQVNGGATEAASACTF